MLKKNVRGRCTWCLGNLLYEAYHDTEWGVPLYDEQKLFEFLVLEIFQAGLSWLTVLKKRNNFRAAFDYFDYLAVASYDSEKVGELLSNKGIIRNQLKITATIANAQAYLKIQEKEGGFSNYIWKFVDGKPIQNVFRSMREVPTSTPLAETISNDLKERGFKFVGPTIVYAHMQATGMVNDHLVSCFRCLELNRS